MTSATLLGSATSGNVRHVDGATELMALRQEEGPALSSGEHHPGISRAIFEFSDSLSSLELEVGMPLTQGPSATAGASLPWRWSESEAQATAKYDIRYSMLYLCYQRSCSDWLPASRV